MAASLLNQTLSLAARTSLTVTSTPTSTTFPVPANQTQHWDAVAVYGFIFGFLALLLAFPGTYLAIVALRRHRAYEARQNARSDAERGIEIQTSDLGSVGPRPVEFERLDGEADK